MVIELSVGGLLTLLGIPTAITSLGLWLLQRRISKREAVQDARDNGDMHAALEYARKVKHAQKDFLTEQGVKAIY